MSNAFDTQHLEEGSLYVYKKGVLQEIETDPDDQMKKIRITQDAFANASELQKQMRKHMAGYRPDMSTVCSALIKHAADSENAAEIVRQFALSLYQSIEKGSKP